MEGGCLGSATVLAAPACSHTQLNKLFKEGRVLPAPCLSPKAEQPWINPSIGDTRCTCLLL